MTSISPIFENIFAVEAACEPGVDVRALLICGEHYTVLVDTLARPADLGDVRDMVDGLQRPLLVVNSHADWDHWWGNAAFPDAPVIAYRTALQRQLREGRRSLAAHMKKDPVTFKDVDLRPATLTFEGTLEIDLGGFHLQLSALPGHTHDHIVAFIPERRLLFAADAAEDPIPLVTEGPIAGWPQKLEEWAARSRIVVPAHGAISGPELLTRNAGYLRMLFSDPRREVPELTNADAFYRRAHRGNLRKASQEAGGPVRG